MNNLYLWNFSIVLLYISDCYDNECERTKFDKHVSPSKQVRQPYTQ